MSYIITYGLICGSVLPLLWIGRLLRMKFRPYSVVWLTRREFRVRLTMDFIVSALLLCSSLALLGRLSWALVPHVVGLGMLIDSLFRARSQPGFLTRPATTLVSVALSAGAVASLVLIGMTVYPVPAL